MEQFDPRQIIGMFGRSPEGVARLRLGRGVVGNSTYGFGGACVAAAVVIVALRETPVFALAAGGMFFAAYCIFQIGTWWFAHRHPDLAMLGDSEWLKYQQSLMAAPGLPMLPMGQPVEAPNDPLASHDP